MLCYVNSYYQALSLEEDARVARLDQWMAKQNANAKKGKKRPSVRLNEELTQMLNEVSSP